jgi:hypothetical protein
MIGHLAEEDLLTVEGVNTVIIRIIKARLESKKPLASLRRGDY